MKTTFSKVPKRLLSLFLTLIMTVALIPLSAISAFAFSTSAGQTVDSEYGSAYVGYDGSQYPVSANQYALRYRADGSTYIESSQIGTRRTKLMIVKNGSKQQALCVEYGVDIARGSGTYTSANYENSSYFNMLPMAVKRGIMTALIYGWQPGKALPISGINEDDYSLATQEIIWEYQQGIRTSPTTRVDNGNIRADQFYSEIKGRPAEKAYNWILEQMAKHAKVPSFTTSNRDNTTTHTLKYNAETKKFSLTLTDTNNTGVDIIATSSSGITVTRSGNKYTFTSNSMITSAVLCEYKKNITLYGEGLLVWGNVGNQTMVTGVADPIRFYVNFKTETYGTGKIVKTSEDGKITDVTFKISGNGINEIVKTKAQGVANLQLLPGVYTVTELIDNKYEPQNAQTVTIVSGQTSEVTFNNVLKKGNVKVTKTAEDGFSSGIKFRLYGTSDSGETVDEYTITDNSGTATFSDILIGTYTLEEVETAIKYITPATQNVTVKWNEVVNAAVHNTLKRGHIKVVKSAEDNFIEGHCFHLFGTSIAGTRVDMYTKTDDNGIAEFSDVLIGTYTIEEVETAEQYITPISQNVIIEWDKVLEISFENKLKRGDVKITKTSEDGFVAEVKFRLYGTSVSGVIVDLFAETNACGIAEFKDVLIGTYTLEEIGSADRYIIPLPQNTVVEWNKVTEKSFYNELKRGEIHGKKKDDVGSDVSGAVIGLFSYDAIEFTEATAILTTTSDEDGSFSFVGVPYGEWIVREIKCPAGYILTEESYSVTVNYHGEVIEIEIVNKRIRGTAQLTKVDADYPENKLTGAEFEVYRDTNGNKQLDESDEFIGKMPEIEVGMYKLTDLIYGGYFVKETVAPEGFYLDSTIHYFEINEDGETVTIENEASVGFINIARVGSLKIVKTSSDDKVDGFSFRVTGPNGYDEVFVTDENGEIIIENLRIGEYKVSEVQNETSSDYVLPADKMATVFADSTTTVEMHNVFRDTPQTGDDTNLLLWLAMACLSGTGFVIFMILEVKSRKMRKKENNV